MATIYDLPREILRTEIIQRLPSADRKLLTIALYYTNAEFDNDDCERISQFPLHVMQYCFEVGYVDAKKIVDFATPEYAYEKIQWILQHIEPNVPCEVHEYDWFDPNTFEPSESVIEFYNLYQGIGPIPSSRNQEHLYAAYYNYTYTKDPTRFLQLISVPCCNQDNTCGCFEYFAMCECSDDIQFMKILESHFGTEKIVDMITQFPLHVPFATAQLYLSREQLINYMHMFRYDENSILEAHKIAPIAINMASPLFEWKLSGDEIIRMVEHPDCTHHPCCFTWNDPGGDAAYKYNIVNWHLSRGGQLDLITSIKALGANAEDMDFDRTSLRLLYVDSDTFVKLTHDASHDQVLRLLNHMYDYPGIGKRMSKIIVHTVRIARKLNVPVDYERLFKDRIMARDLRTIRSLLDLGIKWTFPLDNIPTHIRLYLKRYHHI